MAVIEACDAAGIAGMTILTCRTGTVTGVNTEASQTHLISRAVIVIVVAVCNKALVVGAGLSRGTIGDDKTLDAGVGSEVAVILIGGGTFAVVATTALGRGDTGPIAGDLSRPTALTDSALIEGDVAGPVGTTDLTSGTTGLGTATVLIFPRICGTGITRASEIIFIRIRGTGPFAQDLSSNAFFSRDTGVGTVVATFIDTGTFIIIRTTFS